ncbi:hypothetical protein Lepto7375DRAFT_0739 [Leptolyngbya sp. PCC 7375]|nr:hypothetical protein Lepto7375DRAFT_0739 [Leptolyngbya sp. PCC 7375]
MVSQDLIEAYKSQNFNRAIDLARKEYDLKKKNGKVDYPRYSESAYRLIVLLLEAKCQKEAFSIIEKLVLIHNQRLNKVFSISVEPQKINHFQSIIFEFYIVLSLIFRYLSNSPEVIKFAFELAIKRKAIGIEVALMQRSMIFSEKNIHLVKKIKRIQDISEKIAEFHLGILHSFKPDFHQGYLASLYAEKDRHEQYINNHIPEFSLLSELNKSSCKSISFAMPKDAILVEFIRYKDINTQALIEGEIRWDKELYSVFTLPASETEKLEVIHLGEARPIDRLVSSFRQSVSEQEHLARDPRFPSKSKKKQLSPNLNLENLRKKIFDPLTGHNLKSPLQYNQKIFIAPDGELSCLSFGILPTKKGGYLMQDYNLNYLSVGRDLIRFKSKKKTRIKKPLVISNPDFDYAKTPTRMELEVPPPLNNTLSFHLILLWAVIFCRLLALNIWLAILSFGFGLVLINLCIIVSKSYYPKCWQQLEERIQKYADFFFYPIDPIIWFVLSICIWLSLNIFLVFFVFMLGGLMLMISYPSDMKEFEQKIRNYQVLPKPALETIKRKIFFHPLPCSQKSGKTIASLLEVELHEDTKALKTLLSRCQSPYIIHIGSHGFFLEDLEGDDNLYYQAARKNPLMCSGVVFAGANPVLNGSVVPSKTGSVFLTAQDVANLDLADTELVVTAACQTALGDILVGEGVLGLRRAFIIAGAKTLVMALWSVPDLTTAILMEQFYQNLIQEKMGRSEALKKAQEYIRDLTVKQMREDWLQENTIIWATLRSKPLGEHLKALNHKEDSFRPYKEFKYWGAFICQGDSGPLNLKN